MTYSVAKCALCAALVTLALAAPKPDLPGAVRSACVSLEDLEEHVEDGNAACLASSLSQSAKSCMVGNANGLLDQWEDAADAGTTCFDEATEKAQLGTVMGHCLNVDGDSSTRQLELENAPGMKVLENVAGKNLAAVERQSCSFSQGSCVYWCCQTAVWYGADYWACRRQRGC